MAFPSLAAADAGACHPVVKKVFISHAAADAKIAAELASKLRSDNIEAWVDQKDLLPGDDWRAASSFALENSDAVIVLMTEHSGTSATVRRDVEFALGSKRLAGRVIPVLVAEEKNWSGSWVLKRLKPVTVKGNLAAAGRGNRTGARDDGVRPPSKVKRARKVFLSHSSVDRALATRVASALRKRRFDVWYSTTALRALRQISWFLPQIQCVTLHSDFIAGCKALINQLGGRRGD